MIEEAEARVRERELWELKRRVGGEQSEKEKVVDLVLWMEDAAEERVVEGGVRKVIDIFIERLRRQTQSHSLIL